MCKLAYSITQSSKTDILVVTFTEKYIFFIHNKIQVIKRNGPCATSHVGVFLVDLNIDD